LGKLLVQPQAGKHRQRSISSTEGDHEREHRADRTEKLDELENKSDAMAAASKQFHNRAHDN
tara:strand:+ start:1744 stop:1929 length:186 start_codon:yes stop_codon:yes gene_type:complete